MMPFSGSDVCRSVGRILCVRLVTGTHQSIIATTRLPRRRVPLMYAPQQGWDIWGHWANRMRQEK